MLLFIDTETSGLPNTALPVDHPSQAHIIQLAAWLGTNEEVKHPLDDEFIIIARELRHVASLNAIIRPTDWTNQPAAERIHGISIERARAVGEDLREVLFRLLSLVHDADEDGLGVHGTLIAHNLSFDHRMLLREFAYIKENPTSLSRLRPFCTMRALTPRMRLPSRRPGTYKWPTLDEAYHYCFPGSPRNTATRHSAMGDVLECKDIYLYGRSEGWWA
jgi:DNA polymerase-3 subunit epsilon